MDPRDLNRVLEHLPANVAVLRAAPGFPVVAMTRQLRAMSVDPANVIGRPVFELFPETPEAPGTVAQLTASFERVIASRAAEHHAQRYDVLNPATGKFEERYWSAVNSPVLDDAGNVEYILHQAEDAATAAGRGSMAILDAMTEGVFTLDRSWRFSYLNPEANRILGEAPGALVGLVLWDKYPGTEHSEFGEHYRRTMEERVSSRFTAFHPVLERWYEVIVYPAPEGISVYFRDITARVLAEQDRERLAAESERQRRLYETALSNTPDFVYIFGTDHRALYANESLLKVWGTDEVRGKTWIDLGYEQWHAEVHDRELAQVIETKAPIRGEIPFTGTNGRRIYDYIFAPVFDADGNVVAVAGTTRDVTERQAAEQTIREHADRLAESRARLDYAVRLSGIGFWYCDLPFDELIWDSRVKEHFWLPPDALVTIDTFYERIHPDDREPTRRAIAVSNEQGTPYDVYYRTCQPRGDGIKWIRALGGTAFDAEGRPIRFDGVTVDVTVQKNAEAETRSIATRLQEADRRKDEFLAMLAHELRNPLAPIGTAAQILKRSNDDATRTAHAAEIIERQVGHMTSLVDDLLDVSRVTRGLVDIEKETVDVRAVVNAAIEQVQPLLHARRHELRTSYAASDFHVIGDFHRLVQVVTNLLANAAKYTPQQGVVTLEITADAGDAVLRVSDNGVGIHPDMLDAVFELFTQAERTPDRTQGGLGIGLALVRSLVVLHGGSVVASSDGANRGSTFTVRLPLAEKAARDERAWQPESAAGRPCRVLLVDDNRDAASTFAELLELLGHTVSIAPDGGSALAQASDASWDVYVLDIGLPDMTGFELAKRLRATTGTSDATFIALTGYGQAHDRVMSKAAGFDHHMVKPPDVRKLIEILDAR
jgi:PAS domain S-box-containing protein